LNKIIILIVGVYFSIFGQTANESLKISHLTGDYYVFTTYRTFKGKPMSSNGMYLVTDNGVVMIDTPWDTTQFQSLLDSIEIKHKKKVVLCIATHSHEDRTAGLEFLRQKGIKTYASKQTYEICKENSEKIPEYYFVKDTTFKVGQYSFQTFYGGEGHTKDNIVIWFSKNQILYGGCVIKSTEATDLGWVGDSNLKAWPITLNNIKRKFPSPKFIITGHQDWRNIKSLDHTLDLLEHNEK
jgi:metallo-beta-lactamase class B